jgi:hypothetical protein
MFQYIDKLTDSFLLEEINKSIIIKNVGNTPYIGRLSGALQPAWQYAIREKAGQYVHTHLNQFVFFENNESTFVNKDDGAVVKKEPAYYFVYEPGLVAVVKLDKQEVIELQHKNYHSQVPHEISNKYFFGGYLIQAFYTGKYITCHSLADGSLKWKVTYSELSGTGKASLFSELLQENNKLFFFLSDAKRYAATFVLDMESGQLLHQTSAFGGRLALNNSKLYVVNPRSIGVMDIKNFETHDINVEELLQPDTMLAWDIFSVQDNLVYFSDANSPVVGVLDMQAKKLLWYEDLQAEHKSVKKVLQLQVHNNRLYISGADQALYIFQRD